MITDNRQRTMLQKYIHKTKETKINNLKFCGASVIKETGSMPAVFVLKNDHNRAKFFGNISCHSKWACPVCTPVEMAKVGINIAAAIDALITWQNQYPCMITFTLPHHKYMSCEDATQILKLTWRKFTRAGNHKGRTKTYTRKKNIEQDKRATGHAGETIQFQVGQNPYGKFREELQSIHNIRVYEYTWSTLNGWHPHIHALFWIPEKNFDKILDYEQSLLDHWWKCAKRAALEYWNGKFPDKEEENKKHVETLYADEKKITNVNYRTGQRHKALIISKDKKDPTKARKVSSSHYISGWGGDAECTKSQMKIAREGHFTPFQILDKASSETDEDKKEQWLKLFLEYAKATVGSRRTQFSSRSGINKIISKWKLTNQYAEIIKKKFMEKATVKWKVVYWFTEKQWSEIYRTDILQPDKTLQIQILELARGQPNIEIAKELIKKLLLENNIDTTKNGEHPLKEHIEQKVFAPQSLITEVTRATDEQIA